jgi:D5 N terminal like
MAERESSHLSVSPLLLHLCDDYIALLFTEIHERDARYVAKWGKWFFWRQTYWKEDSVLKGRNASREVCRKVALTLSEAGQQRKAASKVTISAVEQLAMSSPELSLEIDVWDRNLRLINNPEKPEGVDD